jgi:TPR repeat protein
VDLRTALRRGSYTKKQRRREMQMAQFNLGVMYYEGESVPQDFVEAYKWADIAAVGGLVEALELKEAAAVQMNQDSLMKAKALAQEFLEKRKGRP